MSRPKCYLTSPVFREVAEHPKVSKEKKKKILDLWKKLEEVTELSVSNKRFPSAEEISEKIQQWGAQIIGCHLSHPITSEMLKNSDVVAVCTSTSGYNHIAQEPGILITHTPGVLHQTVADFTIAAIMSNLRNIVGLHNFVWNGEWEAGQKWDLDENLSTTIDNLTLGIIGMGEIGKELTKRLYPWGVKILYFDIRLQEEFEKNYPNIQYVGNLEVIFSKSDIISLHVPLMDATHHLVNAELLKVMKKGALLVNTARGPIIDTEALLKMLEGNEIEINLAFDVFEDEPIKEQTLERFKRIADKKPQLKFIFIPHNASADADTRAQMAIMILTDLINIATSSKNEDLQKLNLIPEFGDYSNPKMFDQLKIRNMWIKKRNN